MSTGKMIGVTPACQSPAWPAAVIALAFAVGTVAAVRSGWHPVGDNAKQLVGVTDVLRGAFPLTGQVTSGGRYGASAYQVGPMTYYVFAGPVALFGPTWGMMFAGGAISAASIVAIWWTIRRTSPTTADAAVAAVGLIIAGGGGTAYFYDPLHTIGATLPTIAALVAIRAWGMGAVAAAPIAAIAGSYAVQAHVQFGGVVVVAAIATVALARRNRATFPPVSTVLRRTTVGIMALCWVPTLLMTISTLGTNLTDLVRAGGNAGERVGGVYALRALVLSMIGLAPQTASDTSGWPPPLALAVGLGLAFTAVALAVRVGGPCANDLTVAGVVVGAATMLVALSPEVEGFTRIRLLPVLSAAGYVWAVVLSPPKADQHYSARTLALIGRPACIVAAVLLCSPLPLNGPNEYAPWTYDAVADLGPAVVNALERANDDADDGVAIRPLGPRSMLLVALGLTAHLERAGFSTALDRPPSLFGEATPSIAYELLVLPTVVEVNDSWRPIASTSVTARRTDAQRSADTAAAVFAETVDAEPLPAMNDALFDIACLTATCPESDTSLQLADIEPWLMSAVYLEQFDENFTTELLATRRPPDELLEQLRSAYSDIAVTVYWRSVP